MTLRTFGFIGSFDPTGGVYGLGTLKNGVLDDAVCTTRFKVVDSLHPNGHNGTDLSSLAGEGAAIKAPLGGMVAQNYAVTWPGPGTKTLFSFTDENGNLVEKVLQPGDLDRGGNTVILIHPGPWKLLDGSVVQNAATLYCHLRELPARPVGTWIDAGEVIGYEGTTGYSTGAHLHWSLAFQQTGGIFPPNMSDIPNLSDPLPYIGIPVTDVAAVPFEGTVNPSGLSLASFSGSIAQLEETCLALGVTSVSATVDGKYVVYVPGAPAFVNDAFVSQFPTLNHTPVMVKVGV